MYVASQHPISSLIGSQGRHAVIWSTDRLPYDSRSLVPVPAQNGGGALVLAVNSILYFNQVMIEAVDAFCYSLTLIFRIPAMVYR
jgi:hypothetical protein